MLNRRRFGCGCQIIEWEEFGSHREIIELRISWPQPNSWIENFMATMKLLNWAFCGHSQIIELRISWPPWNYWIENSVASAKLLNWDHHEIIELSMSWQPNYWIDTLTVFVCPCLAAWADLYLLFVCTCFFALAWLHLQTVWVVCLYMFFVLAWLPLWTVLLHPNYYWIDNLVATSKLIIKLIIWLPQPNYWIELECGCDSEFFLSVC